MKKDVYKYYTEICGYYSSMVLYIKNFEQVAMHKFIDEETLDTFKNMINPIKETYNLFAYICNTIKNNKFDNFIRVTKKDIDDTNEIINKLIDEQDIRNLDLVNSLQHDVRDKLENYNLLLSIKILLNRPCRKHKWKKYYKSLPNNLKGINSNMILNNLLSKNEAILDSIKQYIEKF